MANNQSYGIAVTLGGDQIFSLNRSTFHTNEMLPQGAYSDTGQEASIIQPDRVQGRVGVTLNAHGTYAKYKDTGDPAEQADYSALGSAVDAALAAVVTGC